MTYERPAVESRQALEGMLGKGGGGGHGGGGRGSL